MENKINLKPDGKFYSLVVIIVLFVFLMICGFKARGQEIKDYYPTNVCMIYADGNVIEDTWEVGYGFDNLNNLVYFNMRPNETEEFSVVHKIYNITDSFDQKQRLVMSDYYLDDLAMLYIRPLYDEPDSPMTATRYHVKLVETLPYTMRRTDIKSVEFSFFTIY